MTLNIASPAMGMATVTVIAPVGRVTAAMQSMPVARRGGAVAVFGLAVKADHSVNRKGA